MHGKRTVVVPFSAAALCVSYNASSHSIVPPVHHSCSAPLRTFVRAAQRALRRRAALKQPGRRVTSG